MGTFFETVYILHVTMQERLADKYKVTGIPTLVIVDGSSGATISEQGRRLVMTDPEGFPWK